jgi:hypothetical protein
MEVTMGRYYNGDIEGKFWFAVQSSHDADFFGVEGESVFLNYYFNEDNLKDIEKGIEECKKSLGQTKEILDQFFNSVNGYNDKMIIDYFKEKHNITLKNHSVIRDMLGWYARLELGEKIHKCVKEKGHCNFEAEL